MMAVCFYARKQLLLSLHLSHQNSVRLSVCPSVTRVDQSKVVQTRITKSSSSAAWKTLVSGNVKLSINSKGVTPNEGIKLIKPISCCISVMVRDMA